MKKILLSLFAIILIIEEGLWDLLTAFGHTLVNWLKLGEFEQWLSRLSPMMALIPFSLPILIILPINISAFGLLAKGLILQGMMLEVLAKLLGTLLVARAFALTKPQLLTFSFIRFTYNTITFWVQWAHQKIVDTTVYRLGSKLKAEANVKFAKWFS